VELDPDPHRPLGLTGRTAAALVAAAVLVGVVGFLLVANQRSARTLRENLLRQRAQQVQLQAVTVAHLLSSAVEDLRNLAESREVAAFHENRDLGMSMEYGLALSLVPIRERLVALSTQPRRQGQPAFSRLALLDAGGAVLADSAGSGAVPWPGPIPPDAAGVELSPDGQELVAVLGYRFKGREVGGLVGWLRPGPVTWALATAADSGVTRLLDPRGRPWLAQAAPGRPEPWSEIRPPPPDGQMVEVVSSGGEAVLAVRVPVPGHPFSLLLVDRAKALLGGLSPAQSTASLSAAVLLVLGAALLAIFLSTKAMVLRARLEESIRRESEVEEKHRALEREVAERQRLEKSRALLAQAVDQAGEAIAVNDATGRFEYVNPAFERITGWKAEEINEQQLARVAPEVLEGEVGGSLRAALRDRRAWKGELPWRRRDGVAVHLDLVVSPVHDAAGAVVSFVTVARDVTEEQRLREQLRHSQKLEAVGQLAGGVAHDFNNLLAVIIGFVGSAQEALPAQHPARQDLDEVVKAGRRAADLVRQLLAFGRRQAMSLEVMDLDSAVAGVEKMLRRLIREDIELVTRPGAATPWVTMDRGQLEQVLVNLVVNARDAMPAGGRLTLTTGVVSLSEQEARRYPEGAPGAWVRLRVEDTGTGMDEETLSHLFEPYFTTKEVGKGTGLGLSMVHGIVHQSHGFIDVVSRPGAGSIIEIYLPAAEAPVVGAPAPASPPPVRIAGRPGETVLVVEDDPQLLELLRGQLGVAGFTVLVAADGQRALELASRHRGRIDVLLSDVVMPNLGGPELAERFKALQPEGLVVFMSGYADQAADPKGLIQAAAAFVQKPQGLEGLPALLRQLLDAPHRAARS
jgi:PAS domain S-box-containing protein